MRYNKHYTRVLSIITADDIPRTPDGRTMLCHFCQRHASWAGSFTLLLADDLFTAAQRKICEARSAARVLRIANKISGL